MTLRRTINLSIITAGISAVASQIIFMREFLVVFYGNEISIGIILASWLVWGALGSAVLGRISDRITNEITVFSVLQVALAIIFPLTLVLIRISKLSMGMVTGEIIGYLPMMMVTFAVLAVPCVLMGYMFSLACRMYDKSIDVPGETVARVYIFEALGSFAGGLIVSCFLIRVMPPLAILFMLSFMNLAAALALERYVESAGTRRVSSRITVIILILFSIISVAGGTTLIRARSLQSLWSGFDVLASKDSVYGNVAVTKSGDQRSFYENGLHLYTVPDRMSAEEAVHFALLESSSPKKVLLIGGGVGGLLEEVLKHPVERVDYIELDPVIVSMAREHLRQEDSEILDDPKVKILNTDARTFVKGTKEKYDCIIINLGDPYTAQINRFYTVEFFAEAARLLGEQGVIAFGLTSSANYISNELRDYLNSIYLSLRKVFPEVFMIPGDTVHFIATRAPGSLLRREEELTERLNSRGIKTEYVRDYYLFDRLSQDRVDDFERAMSEGGKVGINRDFKPVSYYYATVFWSTHFDSPGFRKFLRAVTPDKIWGITALLCFGILFLTFISRRKRSNRTVLLAVMTTGFAEINFQIAVILSFQVIYGYVFYKLGIIITSFMVGLAMGGWIALRTMKHIKDDMKVFRWIQVSICIYPMILPVLFVWLSGAQSKNTAWLGANIVFPVVPVIAGIIGGMQFPLANRIYLGASREVGRVAGLCYGLDLAGACLGALLTAAFLVPVLGIFQVCFLVAIVNAAVLGALLIKREAA